MTDLTKKYQEDLRKALNCAEKGKAYHWPTVAEILADEVKRLQSRPNDAKWISVEDGIEPNHLQGVLTVENDDEDTLCLEVYIGKSKNGKLMFSESYPREPVTHYMPLPTPPKQSSEGEEG